MPSQGRTFASVERFLAEVINHRAYKGQTPLMLACANGCSPSETPPCPHRVHKAVEPKCKAIRFLACSRVRSRTIGQLVPGCRRHEECVRYLLAEDADPFLVDRAHLRTALHSAAAYGHAGVLRVLLRDDLTVSAGGQRLPLRSARVRDMSGICRFCSTSTRPHLLETCHHQGMKRHMWNISFLPQTK